MYRVYNTLFNNLISATTTGQKTQFVQDGILIGRQVNNQIVVMDEKNYYISLDRLAYCFTFSSYSNHAVTDGGKIIFLPSNIVGQKLILGEDTLEFAETIVDLYGLSNTVIGALPSSSTSNKGTNQVAITFVNMSEITTSLLIGSNSSTSQYVSFVSDGLPDSKTTLYSVSGSNKQVGTPRTIIITALFNSAGKVTGINIQVLFSSI